MENVGVWGIDSACLIQKLWGLVTGNKMQIIFKGTRVYLLRLFIRNIVLFKCSIGMEFVRNPRILICDEVTSGIDFLSNSS